MSPSFESVSIAKARRIAVHAQRLTAPLDASGKEGAAQTIDHLGYVQIDTISVIERAHHHTLWNRCPDYRPDHLHELQAVDRRIFEYWAHAIAYLPISDYRFYLPRMARHRSSERAWLSEWRSKHPHILDHVYERIRKEGALSSKDFEPPPGTKRGTWWDWKPAKRALEILFWQGDLMISSRERFQKLYDLTERVLPRFVDTTCPNCGRGRSLPCPSRAPSVWHRPAREIERTLSIADRETVRQALDDLATSGEVVGVSVDGLKGPFYALPSALEPPTVPPDSRAILLSRSII